MFTDHDETALRTGQQPTDPRRSSERPTLREMFAEIVPLIGAVAGYGPPVIFLAGPWLLLGLMLAGPVAWLFALVVVMIIAAMVLAALTAGVLAILTAPYLLFRHVCRHRARPASISAPAAQAVAIESPRVAA
jgi:hypothetical protein